LPPSGSSPLAVGAGSASNPVQEGEEHAAEGRRYRANWKNEHKSFLGVHGIGLFVHRTLTTPSQNQHAEHIWLLRSRSTRSPSNARVKLAKSQSLAIAQSLACRSKCKNQIRYRAHWTAFTAWHGLRNTGKLAPPQMPRIIALRSITSRATPSDSATLAALRVPFSPCGLRTMRFAAVSCPLAPQASHASSSVLRQFQALRSSFILPLGGSHPFQQFKGRFKWQFILVALVLNLTRRFPQLSRPWSHPVRSCMLVVSLALMPKLSAFALLRPSLFSQSRPSSPPRCMFWLARASCSPLAAHPPPSLRVISCAPSPLFRVVKPQCFLCPAPARLLSLVSSPKPASPSLHFQSKPPRPLQAVAANGALHGFMVSSVGAGVIFQSQPKNKCHLFSIYLRGVLAVNLQESKCYKNPPQLAPPTSPRHRRPVSSNRYTRRSAPSSTK